MDRERKGYSDYDPLEGFNDYEEENEAQDEYHRRTQQKVTRTEKSLKTVFGLIIAALVVLVLLLVAIFGIKNKISKNKDADETTVAAEETTADTAEGNYTPGLYSVTAAGSLRLREEHSMEGKQIMSVPSGTKLNITEIFFDEYAVNEEEKYWGKTDYKGNSAWVCLAFMTKENAAVVDESTTADTDVPSDNETTLAEAENTTNSSVVPGTSVSPIENTSVHESATGSSAVGTYSTGNYTYTGTDSKLHMRSGHTVSSDSIADIPAGEIFNVTEIVADENAESDALKYWGHISYSGYDGWVCMSVIDAAQ